MHFHGRIRPRCNLTGSNSLVPGGAPFQWAASSLAQQVVADGLGDPGLHGDTERRAGLGFHRLGQELGGEYLKRGGAGDGLKTSNCTLFTIAAST